MKIRMVVALRNGQPPVTSNLKEVTPAEADDAEAHLKNLIGSKGWENLSLENGLSTVIVPADAVNYVVVERSGDE